jgi:twitching motility protein PilT
VRWAPTRRLFKDALRNVLRQDPDVVLIGELRDHETVEAALTVIAETGHLVLGTLHTNSAWQAIHRVVDMFPAHQQQQIRAQLSFVLRAWRDAAPAAPRGRARAGARLRGARAQRRIRVAHPRGQDPPDLLADAGRPVEHSGMQTMNQSLAALVAAG